MLAIELLLNRRSARRLVDPAPDDASLGLMLASAVRAPDHGRLRPWRFLVIRGSARERFGALLAGHLARVQPAASPEALERERQKAQRAPVVIVVAAIQRAEARVPRIEQVLSAGAAAEHILLAAQALGFGAMWKTGEAAYDAQIKTALGLAAADDIVGFIYVGSLPSEAGSEPERPDWRAATREWVG